MPGEKLSILYYDDQEEHRTKFIARHGERFEIRLADDISDVVSALATRSDLPDLLVLDLYHDIDRSEAGHMQRVEEAQAALRELEDVLHTAKAKVDAAWQPAALDTLTSSP